MIEEGDSLGVAFQMNNRTVRFTMKPPARASFVHTPQRGLKRSESSAEAAYEQAVRERWRALLLVIKAKLESVQSGIETFDEAFMAQLVMPGQNKTVGQILLPQLAQAYIDGSAPLLLSART